MHTAGYLLRRSCGKSLPHRRHIACQLALPLQQSCLVGSPAEGQELVEYVDAADKFRIMVPSNWESGSGDLNPNTSRFSNTAGLSRVVGFVPPGKSGVNVSVTVTPLGADYTSLGSFGTPQIFGENLVGSMDRSYLLRGPAWAKNKDGPVQVGMLCCELGWAGLGCAGCPTLPCADALL